MSDDERSSSDRLPRVLVFDGDAESYLDADEAYQRPLTAGLNRQLAERARRCGWLSYP